MSVPADGMEFALQHVASGLYLAIKDNVTYAGGEAVLSEFPQGHAHQWFLQEEQDAHYLINSSNREVCLNIAYESTVKGGSMQQWLCNGGRSELWTLRQTSCGSFVILNKNSGLAAGSSGSDLGSVVIQVDPDDRSAHWAIEIDSKPTCMPETTAATTDVTGTANVCDVFPGAATLADEVIYNIYVPIFSPSGTLNVVTQELPRIARMGFSTILLMPIHPIGVPTSRHPAVGSPYAVSDFYAVEPTLGTLSDFASLVDQAHRLKLKVIMDVVLNHTAWNHPFITGRPTWYVHHDNKKKQPESIAQAFWFEDVAQLDYKSHNEVQEYMARMLVWWIDNFRIDGFRFDTVDNPYGKNRMIPASTWHFIGQRVKATNPNAILLGECTNPELSLKPFNMDYTNYSLQPAVVAAIKAQNASNLRRVLHELKTNHPSGMLHCSIMQTWDMDLDLRMYGGPEGTLVAAIFDFTIEGVPMLFAGEEVGNERSGVNTHTLIDWHGPLATRFRNFYSDLSRLRKNYAALRRGSTTWLNVLGAGAGTVAFLRTYQEQQCLVAINFSNSISRGTCHGASEAGWTQVTPSGAAYSAVHISPPSIELGPWDFAIFVRKMYEAS